MPASATTQDAPVKRREVFTPDQLAEELGWGRDKVYRRLHDGTLPVRRIGQRFVFTRADLIRDGWLSA